MEAPTPSSSGCFTWSRVFNRPLPVGQIAHIREGIFMLYLLQFRVSCLRRSLQSCESCPRRLLQPAHTHAPVGVRALRVCVVHGACTCVVHGACMCMCARCMMRVYLHCAFYICNSCSWVCGGSSSMQTLVCSAPVQRWDLIRLIVSLIKL